MWHVFLLNKIILILTQKYSWRNILSPVTSVYVLVYISMVILLVAV